MKKLLDYSSHPAVIACLAMQLLMVPLFSLAGVKDIAREDQVAEKLAEDAQSTETVWIEAQGRKFLGLFNQQTNEKAAGAVIILHAMGGHADWPKTIHDLRQQLPEQGWSTLSIQLPLVAVDNPVENYGNTLDDAAERIEAAVRFLRARKFLNIVAVGHSFGAVSALHYLADQQNPKIQALVAVGLQDYAFLKPPVDIVKLIEKIQVPLLDIYGGRDYLRVREQASDRRHVASRVNKKYEQIEVEGADHYFSKMENVLAKRIRGWLDKAAPGVSIMVNKDFDGNVEDDNSQDASQP